MRINLTWLDDFVEVPAKDDLVAQLTEAGVEVDGVADATALMQGAQVVAITQVAPHPQADSLRICHIDTGNDTLAVVCGAPNVEQGQRVPYLPVGSQSAQGPIATRTIRGVVSSGMLCSRADLGLEGSSAAAGLWVLDDPAALAAPLGTALTQVVQPPVVLDLGITPNRPDLMSHLGVAREVAASTGKRVKAFKWRVGEKGPDAGLMARVLVDDAGACKRYMARVVRDVRVAPSPRWLQERLESIGQRPINNVVDATNYVMHELGQPLHAYDLTRLALETNLPTVRVRRAHAGERLKTLDGVERELGAEDLIIADAMRPVALAGIMGGMDTWVAQSTTSVLLESAWFAPAAVRRTARAHGLRTEASQRFERGVDGARVSRALDRCAQLLAEIAGGVVAKGALEVAQKNDGPQEIPLRLARVPELLGIALPAETIVGLLDPLEFRCLARTDAALIFEVPSFRPDVTREVDLIEEVARRYGYGRLPERLPSTEGAYSFAKIEPRPQDLARRALLPQGLSEAVTYALANPEHLRPFVQLCGEPVALRNPSGVELSVLRTTLLPGLLGVVQHQLRHGGRSVRLFEVGSVVRAKRDGAIAVDEPQPTPAQATQEPGQANAASSTSALATAPQSFVAQVVVDPDAEAQRLAGYDAALPEEALHVACVLHGERHPGRWYGAGQVLDMADAQGTLEALLEGFDIDVPTAVVAAPSACLNPYAAGDVIAYVGVKPVTLGRIGRLEPAFAASWDVPDDVFVIELSLTALMALPKRSPRALSLSKLPSTRRDVALIAHKDVAVESLRSFIALHAGRGLPAGVVEQVWLFDRYAGKPIASDHISLAFAVSFRGQSDTLTDAEVNAAMATLLTALPKEFPVTVRQ